MRVAIYCIKMSSRQQVCSVRAPPFTSFFWNSADLTGLLTVVLAYRYIKNYLEIHQEIRKNYCWRQRCQTLHRFWVSFNRVCKAFRRKHQGLHHAGIPKSYPWNESGFWMPKASLQLRKYSSFVQQEYKLAVQKLCINSAINWMTVQTFVRTWFMLSVMVEQSPLHHEPRHLHRIVTTIPLQSRTTH